MVVYGFRAFCLSLEELSCLTEEDRVRLSRSDWDILCSPSEFTSLIGTIHDSEILEMKPLLGARYFIKTLRGNYDIHIVDPSKDSSNTILYSTFNKRGPSILDDYGNVFEAVSLPYLFKIKQSHRFIRRGFSKTMEDYYRISALLEGLGLLHGLEEDVDLCFFYQKRYEETLVRADRQSSHINLEQNKEGFFNTKGVTYLYDHDSIHESIKFLEEPIYKKMLIPGEEVACSQKKFEGLSHTQQMYAVLEESYVIAIERFLSKGSPKTPREAFLTALEKVCTTLTKGWFRRFAYENYRDIVEMYDESFWHRFSSDLEAGHIEPYKAA